MRWRSLKKTRVCSHDTSNPSLAHLVRSLPLWSSFPKQQYRQVDIYASDDTVQVYWLLILNNKSGVEETKDNTSPVCSHNTPSPSPAHLLRGFKDRHLIVMSSSTILNEKLCVKWNENLQERLDKSFGELRDGDDFTDVTLACED